MYVNGTCIYMCMVVDCSPLFIIRCVRHAITQKFTVGMNFADIDEALLFRQAVDSKTTRRNSTLHGAPCTHVKGKYIYLLQL